MRVLCCLGVLVLLLGTVVHAAYAEPVTIDVDLDTLTQMVETFAANKKPKPTPQEWLQQWVQNWLTQHKAHFQRQELLKNYDAADQAGRAEIESLVREKQPQR